MKNWNCLKMLRGLFFAALILSFFGSEARPAAAQTIQSPAPSKPRIGGILKFGIVKDIGTPIRLLPIPR